MMAQGFFTQTFENPHPDIPERWIAAIHESLVQSLSYIRIRGFDFPNAKEDDITYQLEQIFENNQPEADLKSDLSFIRSVTRESATANSNKSSIGRKPDLVFRLNRELSQSHDRTQDCIFAECKPVDKMHKLKDHYCAVGKSTSGVERFINGAYASSMRQGMMIAYVRDGFRLEKDLEPTFSDEKIHSGLGKPSNFGCFIMGDDDFSQGLYSSEHERSFIWRDGEKASSIKIYHSWHNC